jgi:DNA polymerase III epsilon subunit-like protein
MNHSSTHFRVWFETTINQVLKRELDAFETDLAWEQVMMMKDPSNYTYTRTPLDPNHIMLKMKQLFDTIYKEVAGELFFNSKNLHINPMRYNIDRFYSILPDPKRTLEEVTQIKRDAKVLSKSPRKVIAFDLETDGIDVNRCNILQFAFIHLGWEDSQETVTPTRLSAYTKPYQGWKVVPAAQKVNKISQATIDQAQPLSEYSQNILDLIKDSILIGYNIHKFDVPILERHFRQLGHKRLPHYMSIDLYQVALKSKLNLSSALKKYDVNVNHNLHDANTDATCCLSLFSKMISKGEATLNPEKMDRRGEGTTWITNGPEKAPYPTPSDPGPSQKRKRIDSFFITQQR